MAEDDLYYTGGTIIMDHGHGISTIYSHLESVLVSVGDQIKIPLELSIALQVVV